MRRRASAVFLACLFLTCICTFSGTPTAARGTRPTGDHAAASGDPGRPRTGGVPCGADPRARAYRLALRPHTPWGLLRVPARPDGHARAGHRPAGAPERRGVIRVPLWVHVIKDGALGAPDSAVKRQVRTLNAAYGGKFGGVDTGVRFELKGITHTANRAWFRDPFGHEREMKRKLRVGGPETLNLYIVQMERLILGYGTYPQWYAGTPELDGVMIDWRSLPGGPLRNFRRGFTAVHEIGHWMGLLHTFENGCDPPGDEVDDTPAEAYPTKGCPARKDTCPGPGSDPIHNFMDYSKDTCMREFTRGQAERMARMWQEYRAIAP